MKKCNVFIFLPISVVDPGGPGARAPLTPHFWGPRLYSEAQITHFSDGSELAPPWPNPGSVTGYWNGSCGLNSYLIFMFFKPNERELSDLLVYQISLILVVVLLHNLELKLEVKYWKWRGFFFSKSQINRFICSEQINGFEKQIYSFKVH